jgi:hypothetical protein
VEPPPRERAAKKIFRRPEKISREEKIMARPRLAESELRENFTVRLSAAEREQVEEKARLLNLTPSDYARACLVQGTVKIVREDGHDPEKVRALLAIGNNLNQIARRLNASGEIPPLLSEVLGIVRAVLTEAGRAHGPTG